MPGVKYTVDVEVNGNGKVDQAQKSFERTSQSVQKINQRLKSMQQELYAMAEGGDKSSKAFLNMAKRAGDLKNAMGDTRAIVNYFADGERAVNGMNSAISATTSTIQGIYGTYSLLGGEANDKLLKNMVALESMNARLSNAYNLLKPDGKAMLYMNEMAKKGSVFASVMGKAGGFVFKMIPAFKALSIASFLGEVTGVNDKIKDWITNTETFKNIMSTISSPKLDMTGISESKGKSGWEALSDTDRQQVIEKLQAGHQIGEFGYLGSNVQSYLKQQLGENYIANYADAVKNLADAKKALENATGTFGFETKEQEQRRREEEVKSLEKVYKSASRDLFAYVGEKLAFTDSGSKKSKKDKGLKSTSNKGERLASNAPSTFNIYIDKMGEVKNMNVTNIDDLDQLGKNIYEVIRKALVQVAAEQAQ